MSDKDDLDRLLDSALATYAEPASGLERRVLDALATERTAAPAKSKQTAFPNRRWMPWAVGLAAAASLLLALSMHYHESYRDYGSHPTTQARNTAPAQPQRSSTPSGILPNEPTHIALVRTPKVHAPHLTPVPQGALPKLDVFPAPQPLTPQEQALVLFVARAPEEERKAVAEAQQRIETPISIAAIHIPPLESHDKDQ